MADGSSTARTTRARSSTGGNRGYMSARDSTGTATPERAASPATARAASPATSPAPRAPSSFIANTAAELRDNPANDVYTDMERGLLGQLAANLNDVSSTFIGRYTKHTRPNINEFSGAAEAASAIEMLQTRYAAAAERALRENAEVVAVYSRTHTLSETINHFWMVFYAPTPEVGRELVAAALGMPHSKYYNIVWILDVAFIEAYPSLR